MKFILLVKRPGRRRSSQRVELVATNRASRKKVKVAEKAELVGKKAELTGKGSHWSKKVALVGRSKRVELVE